MVTNSNEPAYTRWTHFEPDTDPKRPQRLAWQLYADSVLVQWHQLLATDPEEPEVQEFLELHPAMIPGGSGDVGPGGHHGSEMSAVFRRPRLEGVGEFEPDFMWVTRSSGLITPVLVEIEKPSKRWFQKNERPTADFRDAHDQLNDWRSWFTHEQNLSLFRKRFLCFDDYESLPLEPQFVLVYGRQFEFELGGGHLNPDGLRRKRDSQRATGETFITFDSLRPRYDHGASVTVTMTSKGPRPFAFSPVYGTSTDTGEDAVLLGDPSEALARSVMMAEPRKSYILERWNYWRKIELARKRGKIEAGFHGMGIE